MACGAVVRSLGVPGGEAERPTWGGWCSGAHCSRGNLRAKSGGIMDPPSPYPTPAGRVGRGGPRRDHLAAPHVRRAMAGVPSGVLSDL